VARRWGVPAERITYLPNGIDKEWAALAPDRAVTRREVGTAEDTLVVLSLSRLVLSKRIDRIVEAMPDVVRRSRQPVELWITGDGPLRGVLEARCRALGLAARFLGTVSHDRVARILAAADVFVSTSTLTNMSIPTCEAMVMGVPVVALDVGGTSEVVRHEETGLLVAEEDRAGLQDAIARLVNDPELRGRLSDRARAFAAQNFMSWDERVAAEITVLDRLAGGPPAGRGPHPTPEVSG
jgi:glycosyltransferase involved in cell wall biosynthesis